MSAKDFFLQESVLNVSLGVSTLSLFKLQGPKKYLLAAYHGITSYMISARIVEIWGQIERRFKQTMVLSIYFFTWEWRALYFKGKAVHTMGTIGTIHREGSQQTRL